MQKKGKAIVIGTFQNASQQIWAPDADAFESAEEAINELNLSDNILDEIAFELGTTRHELKEKLPQTEHDAALNALLHALQINPTVAAREFRNMHEATSFLNLIKQMDEKRKKEQERAQRRLVV